MTILDRYVLQKFLLPFVYCFFGFLAIWFIFDLSDNLLDFLEGKILQSGEGYLILLQYYASQIPEIIVMCLPINALLALLYSLSAMSRTNEIISMLGAGRSMVRILVPLFAMGLVLVGISAYFNYEQSPHAAMIKKQMLRDIKRGKKKEPGLEAHLYRNREDLRTWFVRKLFKDRNQLIDVQIIEQDDQMNIRREWYAKDAYYNPEMKSWALYKGQYLENDVEGNITKTEPIDMLVIKNWRETPWRIASSVMNPDWLSAPELVDYLNYNHDFPVNRLAPYHTKLYERWALPWANLLVIFIGAPLGIVYSRRGILGSVMTAIALFFLFIFMSSLFVALGKGHRIPPIVAAWGPLMIFFAIGFWLLWFRSTNRDLPKFKLPWSA